MSHWRWLGVAVLWLTLCFGHWLGARPYRRPLDLLSLAERVLKVDARHLHGLVLGIEQTSALLTPDGKAVLRPNLAAIAVALDQLFSAPSPGLPQAGSVCPKADVALRSG